MTLNKLLFFVLSVSILSCAPKVKRNIFSSSTLDLSPDTEILIVELDQIVPFSSAYIGTIKLGDAGLTKNCTYEDMLEAGKKEAIKAGANILQIIKVKPPDFITTCYRVEAKLYAKKNLDIDKKELSTEIGLTEEEISFSSKIKGLRQGAFTFYNAEGYEVVKYDSDKEFNQKNIKSLKKKFKIKKDNLGTKSNKINNDNFFFNSFEENNGTTISKSTIIYLNNENTLSVIELSTPINPVDSFESKFINLILDKKIPNHNFSSSEIDSIYFVNRFIPLGPVCQWQGVRNLYCSYYGQIDWSVFSNKNRAQDFLDQRIKQVKNDKLSESIQQTKVPVKFEGIETMSEKLTFTLKPLRSRIIGSKHLIAYYLIAKIEDNYVVAILSHYGNNQDNKTLPILLSEVMALE